MVEASVLGRVGLAADEDRVPDPGPRARWEVGHVRRRQPHRGIVQLGVHRPHTPRLLQVPLVPHGENLEEEADEEKEEIEEKKKKGGLDRDGSKLVRKGGGQEALGKCTHRN
jgi:hypothetical protein